jgi:hypothetical protein
VRISVGGPEATDRLLTIAAEMEPPPDSVE